MKICNILIIIILFIIILNKITNNIYKIKFTELIRLCLNLFLIAKSGFVNLNKNYCYFNNKYNNDSKNLILHKKLSKKIKILKFPIINYYYICNNNLIRKIFALSPHYFGPGNGKKKLFNLFMKNNVGISEGNLWELRREFNEKSLDTKAYNKLSFKIFDNINKINFNPSNYNQFNSYSWIITNKLIFDNYNMIDELKKYSKLVIAGKDLYKCPFMNFYKNKINNIYNNINSTSILNNFKINNNNKEIDYIDQIPHCFGPFNFIITNFIPSLLCIILNFDNIKNKILKEINNINFNIYSKSTYLHFCIIEHIRMYNTISINADRTVLEDIEIDGIKFKKGQNLILLNTALLFDEEIYDEPNKYNPDRWKNKTINEQNEVFGHGKQQCPSINITPLIYKSIIINLLKKNIKLVEPKIKYEDCDKLLPFDIKFEYPEK